jgi:ankyrin repeat protein
VDFATDVLPIFRQNCVTCHGPSKQRGGMRLDRRSSAMKGLSRRIVPGSSENSFVYHRLMGEYGQQMPPTGALRPEQIDIVKRWIDQGAEWPDALANEADLPPVNTQAAGMVEELGNNDVAAFMKAATADPSLLNARGPEGATPFMYAVLDARAATLAKLLAMGGDVNKRNDANATALMWAATDLEKTRLLVEHGADVNAKSDDIRTPLMIAARRPGGASIVQFLLDHGADPNPNARAETESSPLIEALTAGDCNSAELLLQHGARVQAAGETGLTMAIVAGCPKSVSLIAEKITDKGVFTGSLQDTAVLGDMESARMLIAHGADVNAADPLGRTPLMYAAVSDLLPVDLVQLLIDHGANVNAKDSHPNGGDSGLTVLDIAKHNGDTPVVRLLEKHGATASAMTPVSLELRSDNGLRHDNGLRRADELRRAVGDSLPLLQHADTNFVTKSGCVSCHNNSLTAMTVGVARRRGFEIDEKSDAAQVQANVDVMAKLRDRMRQGFVLPVEDNFSEGVLAYQMIGLAEEGYKADTNTDTAARFILLRQHANGEWPYPRADMRPPLCLDHIGLTVQSMRALQLYTPKIDAEAYRKAIALAASWLAAAHSDNNEDRSWRLAGLAWAGTNKAATVQAMKELLAAQRPDGGWSDLPTMPSTAYATGKSLVALHLAGLPVSAPAYQRGVKLLLKTQQQDGSWYVPTRALSFQPWFDAGFPHAHDQFISSAGTNWAALALAYALPEEKPARVAGMQ